MAVEPGPHIVITGAMGVGKTTVGRLLAEELDLPFLDSDEILEARSGENAAEIAGRDGVVALHDLELEVFLNMTRSTTRSVIAPASSVVDHVEGRAAMSENFTVWLDAPDRVVAIRQGSGGHRRPIGPEELARLRARRNPHLEAVSSIVVETGSATAEDVVEEILGHLRGNREWSEPK